MEKQPKQTKFKRGIPHSVCGTFEFYYETGKCVHCCKIYAANRRQQQQAHGAGKGPNTDIAIAKKWASIPISGRSAGKNNSLANSEMVS